MNKSYYIVIILLSFAATFYAQSNTFIQGVDLSALQEVEANGGVFKVNGLIKDPLVILKENGVNSVRLRIWNNPLNGYNNLSNVLLMAERIKKNGLSFLLDFHYSDTWADPGNQSMPAAWLNLTFLQLKDSVYGYSKYVISELKKKNALPQIVQIGNEIICGMLWNQARICNSYNNAQQWKNFSELIKEGIRGVKDALSPADSIKIMLHIDRGGDNTGSKWFFDGLTAQNVPFDIIGLSYYPWWHGSLSALQFNVNDLSKRYGKEVNIVETAYPWTLNWFDNTNNIVGQQNQLLAAYPASVQGQKEYLTSIIKIVMNIPDSKGSGFYYWAPDWISTQKSGSSWENLTLFDFSGEMLNSISAFNPVTSVNKSERAVSSSFQLNQNFPNPFNPVTTISYNLPSEAKVILSVFAGLGREITRLVDEVKSAGSYKVNFDGRDLSSGIYFYQLRTENYIETKKIVIIK